MKLTPFFLNFDFSGRARRAHVWANWGAWFAVLFVIISASGATSGTGEASAMSVATVLLLIVAIALSTVDGIAMTFRRAHDTGRSGWIWLLLLIPIVQLLPLYWLLIEDSKEGPNKYGPPVKKFYQPDAD